MADNGWKTCGNCNGVGTKPARCPQCNGKGTIGRDRFGNDISCGQCGMSGMVDKTCPTCNGVGGVPK